MTGEPIGGGLRGLLATGGTEHTSGRGAPIGAGNDRLGTDRSTTDRRPLDRDTADWIVAAVAHFDDERISKCGVDGALWSSPLTAAMSEPEPATAVAPNATTRLSGAPPPTAEPAPAAPRHRGRVSTSSMRVRPQPVVELAGCNLSPTALDREVNVLVDDARPSSSVTLTSGRGSAVPTMPACASPVTISIFVGVASPGSVSFHPRSRTYRRPGRSPRTRASLRGGWVTDGQHQQITCRGEHMSMG